jgi:hypothetical protein
VVSAKVAVLTEGVLKAMLLKKFAALAAVVSLAVTLSGAVGLAFAGGCTRTALTRC